MKRSTSICVTSLSLLLVASLAAAPAHAHQQTPERRAGVYQPTLKASDDQVVAQKKLVLSGTVKPATKGGRVVIQKKVRDATWRDETTTTMTKSGRFEYVDRPNTPGVRKYRAVVPASGKHKKGVSKPVTVTVYRWVDLNRTPVRSSSSTYTTSSTMINAVQYAPAYVAVTDADQGFVDWNFSRACLTLRARYGNNDDSDALAQAHISVVADGEAIFTGSFGLTRSQALTLDITGAFRVGFEWTSTNPAGTPEDQSGAAPTMAEPEALCAF